MGNTTVVVESTVELRTAAALFRTLPSKAQQRIAKQMRAEWLPMLGREVISNAAFYGAEGKADVRAAADQRFYTGLNPGIAIGVGKRQFSNGATSRDLIRAYEFGANRTLYSKYRTRLYGKGPVRTVTRRTTRQFASQKRKGYFVYPTLIEVMPKIAAGWIGLVADQIREAMGAENGRG